MPERFLGGGQITPPRVDPPDQEPLADGRMPCVIEDTLASDFMKPLYAIDLENGIDQHELAKGIAMAQDFGSTFPPSCEHSGVALMQLLRSSSRLRSVHCFNVAIELLNVKDSTVLKC